MNPPERMLVVWVPDWPVRAHLAEQRQPEAIPSPHGGEQAAEASAQVSPRSAAALPSPLQHALPLALTTANRVIACSEAARTQGVRAGMRTREALAQCPELQVSPHAPDTDTRQFAPVIAAIEAVTPGVDPLRPGVCALRSRGPARYYGSEEAAAAALLDALAALGVTDARVGIAQGVFTAQQAARATTTAAGVTVPAPGMRFVAPEDTASFLAPLPIDRAASPQLAGLLHGLGIRTLGAYAELPEEAVRQRFGGDGVAAHRRARATAPAHGTELRPRQPARDYSAEITFEPPLDSSERLAFACAQLAESFIAALAEAHLVCTALRVELIDDIDVRHERLWTHPQHFSATDITSRIRWQADASVQSRGRTSTRTSPWGTAPDPAHQQLPYPSAEEGDRGGAGIALVRLFPARTERAADHEPTLWSTQPDERVHHRFTQLQSRLGRNGVGSISLGGGRLLAERQRYTPWGSRGAQHAAASPWPGALPAPHPSRVFTPPLPTLLQNSSGHPVEIDSDDLLSDAPTLMRVTDSAPTTVSAWSAPWAIRERWWEGRPQRFRLQIVTTDGAAWLLYAEAGDWFAEGRYD